MARRSVVGKSRTHANPGSDDAKCLENVMARKQHTDKAQLAKIMVSKGSLTDISKTMTKVRRTGGVAIRTPIGYTSRPHIIEIGAEMVRRKRIVLSYLSNTKGILAYFKKYFKSNLQYGATGSQNDVIARVCLWCERTLKHALALEKKLGLSNIR